MNYVPSYVKSEQFAAFEGTLIEKITIKASRVFQFDLLAVTLLYVLKSYRAKLDLTVVCFLTSWVPGLSL